MLRTCSGAGEATDLRCDPAKLKILAMLMRWLSFEFLWSGIGDSPTPPPTVSILTYDGNGGRAADTVDRLFIVRLPLLGSMAPEDVVRVE